jgi:hypothetical protein
MLSSNPCLCLLGVYGCNFVWKLNEIIKYPEMLGGTLKQFYLARTIIDQLGLILKCMSITYKIHLMFFSDYSIYDVIGCQ